MKIEMNAVYLPVSVNFYMIDTDIRQPINLQRSRKIYFIVI